MNLSGVDNSALCTSNCSLNYTNIDVGHLCVTLQRTFDNNAKGWFASNILSVIINSLFAIFAAAVNLLVMIALNRKEELRTAANLVLNSMALSDFLVGLIAQPLKVVAHVLDIYNLESCKINLINSYLGIFCTGASMFSAIMFAVDRCFAIMFPFRYQEHLIYKKYVAVIVCGWVFLLFFGLMTYFDVLNKRLRYSLLPVFLNCSVVFMCFCYIIIYKEIRKKKRMVHILPAIQLHLETPNDADKESEEPVYKTIRTTNEPPVIAKTSNDVAKEMKQRKIAKIEGSSSKQNSRSYTVLAILTAFLLCYLPVTIVNSMFQAQVFPQRALVLAYDWTNFLVLLNSSINPIIYCIRVRQIRSEVKKLLKL